MLSAATQGINDQLQAVKLASDLDAQTEQNPTAPARGSHIVRFTNGKLCSEGEMFSGDLWVDTRSGIIIGTCFEPQGASQSHYSTIDLQGNILCPGFIDVQLNGAFGLDFSDSKLSPEEFDAELKRVAKCLIKTGVTAYCPTLPSTYNYVYEKVLPHLRAQRINDGAESLGYHLEGPFLNPKKPGCHPLDAIMTAPKGVDTFVEVYGGEENVRNAAIITVAAEMDGVMSAIEPLTKEMGVRVSLGHSLLDYYGACEATYNGASMVTHMYNAMTQPHHRDPGLFGMLGVKATDVIPNDADEKAYEKFEKPFFGIIVDGIHVHPSAVNIAYHANPEGCCLVTDAMFPMGLPSGTYPWGRQAIVKEDIELYLDGTSNRTIAGSAVEMDTSLQNLVDWANIPLEKAVQTCTAHPAKFLGIMGKKGTLRKNADADLTVIDATGRVKQVYKLGQLVYRADK